MALVVTSHSGICPQGALLVPYKCLTTNLSVIPSTSQAYKLGTERGTSRGKMLTDKLLLLKLPNRVTYMVLIYLASVQV
jgi:hypothetical protein